jgi:hypothetical protein
VVRQPEVPAHTRLYGAVASVAQRGTIPIDYPIAWDAAAGFYEHLRRLFAERRSLTTFGPYSDNAKLGRGRAMFLSARMVTCFVVTRAGESRRVPSGISKKRRTSTTLPQRQCRVRPEVVRLRRRPIVEPSALEPDLQIPSVENLVEAVGDETRGCQAKKPAAQSGGLRGEDPQ